MTNKISPPIARAQLLIRKPVAQVFEALVDPAITARFWLYVEQSDPEAPEQLLAERANDFVFLQDDENKASQRRSKISKPAAIASTASTILTVVETRTLSNGKSPVRINQIASRIIPRLLPPRVFVIAI